MLITKTTPLSAIAERMGTEATSDDAAAMLAELLAADITDTDDVSESEWLAIMDRALAS